MYKTDTQVIDNTICLCDAARGFLPKSGGTTSPSLPFRSRAS